MEQGDEVRSEDGKSTRFCVTLVTMVSPSIIDFGGYSPEQNKKYYTIYINEMYKIASQYNGKFLKTSGDTIKSYFPNTSNKNDIGAIKVVLECCLTQLENRDSISKLMNREGLPKIYYKIVADYEMLRFKWDMEDWNAIPVVPLINMINQFAPVNGVSIGEDLYASISDLDEINEKYKLAILGRYAATSRNPKGYSLYYLGRKMRP